MLFRPKNYFRPETIDEAVSLFVRYGKGARLIARGTDLLVEKPPWVECLIDITRLPLNYIRNDEKGIKIGALTTFRNLQASPLIKEDTYRVLAEAAHAMGHVNIMNVATVGGNICNAVPSADLPPALMVLDTNAKIVGPTGERVLPLEEFFAGVRKTVLKSSELLTEVQVPRQPAHTGTAFCKIGRTRLDIALVNAAVRVTLGAEEVCEDARIALGAVAPTPIRAERAEKLLKGKKIKDALIEKVAQEASEETKPISDIRASADYRKTMSRVLVKRALKQALERAKAGG